MWERAFLGGGLTGLFFAFWGVLYVAYMLALSVRPISV